MTTFADADLKREGSEGNDGMKEKNERGSAELGVRGWHEERAPMDRLGVSCGRVGAGSIMGMLSMVGKGWVEYSNGDQTLRHR